MALGLSCWVMRLMEVVERLIPVEPEHLRLRSPCWRRLQVPGVSNIDFLRAASNARRKAIGQAELVRRLLLLLLPHLHIAAPMPLQLLTPSQSASLIIPSPG
jgi:hypothetical protein